MNKITDENGYMINPTKYFKIRSCVDKKPFDFNQKIKLHLQYRAVLCDIWFKTEDFKTKGYLEDEIDKINEVIKLNLEL